LNPIAVRRSNDRRHGGDQQTIIVQRGDNRVGMACARAIGAGHDS